MADGSVLYEKKDGIATITLNRPAKKNAINLGMRNGIIDALKDAGDDDSVRAVIITGGSDVFCSGVDLTDMPPATLWQKVSPKRTYSYYHLIEDMGKPVIAAIAGYCLAGGLELACSCDIRIAADNALLGDAHARAGVFPGGGSTQKLPRLIGIARAKEMVFSGEPITAAEAERISLVNKVVPVASLMAEARKLAELYKSRPPLVLKLAKAAINDGMQMPLAQGIDYEAKCQTIVQTTEDYKEAMTAFKEKRKPVFRGK